jgi:hypothetical protein
MSEPSRGPDSSRTAVRGRERLVAKHPAVDGTGRPRATPIDGVRFAGRADPSCWRPPPRPRRR